MTQQNETVADIAAQLAELSEALGQVIEDKSPPKKCRVVSKMAKNVNHGDVLNFPDSGWGKVNGWAYFEATDTVVLGAPGVSVRAFPGTQRVRVKRTTGS